MGYLILFEFSYYVILNKKRDMLVHASQSPLKRR